ncbi:MAG TPA: zinc ribbon domain-containing protein [Pyrinomonadaceae bacterium]|nr:zinc ribbon domain-containing protein [Pyrinomonadaceae bacterium]
MAKMVCPTCGQSYSDELLYCLSDGTALVEERDDEVETVAHPRIVIDPFANADHEYCPSCGTPNKVGSRFCKKCGQPLADDIPAVVAAPPPQPVYVEEPRRTSYAGIIAGIFAGAGLLLILIVIGIIVAWNWNSSTAVNVNTQTPTPTKSPTPKTPSPTPTADNSNASVAGGSRVGKTGTLTTDANLRESADPSSPKVGTQYKGAKVKVLEVTEVPNDEGTTSIWYHVVVTKYGTSVDPNNYGLDKDPDSLDEGWINSNPKVYDPVKKAQVRKQTVSFDEP